MVCPKLILCTVLELLINYNLQKAHSDNATTYNCLMLLQIFCTSTSRKQSTAQDIFPFENHA